MAGADPATLVARGLPAHEARWLIEEFSDSSALERAVSRRLAGEPLQYVIGHWPFRSLDLVVDENVLIPRPETEELVDVALLELATCGAAAPRILDLGCGSGAIGLALLAELEERGVLATLVALDVSPAALALARRNALAHGLTRVSFVESSWFEGLDPSLRGGFDLVVANPPYVAASEMDSLDPVLAHEPRGALVAPDTPAAPGFGDLAIVIAEALEWMRDRSALVCEHGADQGEAVLAAARAAGFTHVEDRTDMAGHARILVARRP
ncbi:MAG: peptide chain release factor N(5)-glutamine methyltransferase [Acidobacteriota bacterium]|nr:peptide chain release factor N(5)-glutamine methyltransferase [Acidobacteriota bacterium]